MTYRIIVEPEAVNDLQNIYRYIKTNDSEAKAVKFLSQLYEKIRSLERMPERCRPSYYSEQEGTKDLIHKGYTIVFSVQLETVHILTIFRQREF